MRNKEKTMAATLLWMAAGTPSTQATPENEDEIFLELLAERQRRKEDAKHSSFAAIPRFFSGGPCIAAANSVVEKHPGRSSVEAPAVVVPFGPEYYILGL